MSGFLDKIKDQVAILKEIFTMLREVILVIALLLLLILPEFFNGVLVRAGFTEADFGFIKWKRQVEELQAQTRAADALLAQVESDLSGIEDTAEAQKAAGGEIGTARGLDDLPSQVQSTLGKTQLLRQQLNENLKSQQQLLDDIEKRAPRK